jgi:hypothetical protein
MMLSGVEWRYCETCPRRLLVIRGLDSVKCESCRDAERMAPYLERRRNRLKNRRAESKKKHA